VPTVTEHADDAIRTYQELVIRWDLIGLRRELDTTLAGLQPEERAFVPSQLARALGMFIESYGTASRDNA
jgi:hypothetical protein